MLDVVSYYPHSKTITLSTTKPTQWHVHPAKTGIIRIFNGCGVQIEYFVIPSDGSSSSHRTTTTDSFSCLLFLRQLYLSLDVHYFINFTLTQVCFWSRNIQFSYLWRRARGRLTPPGIRRKYPEWMKISENLVGYARKAFPLALSDLFASNPKWNVLNCIFPWYFH